VKTTKMKQRTKTNRMLLQLGRDETVHGEPAVYGHNHAVDVGTSGHGEESDDGTNLVRFADAPHRRAIDDGFVVDLIL